MTPGDLFELADPDDLALGDYRPAYHVRLRDPEAVKMLAGLKAADETWCPPYWWERAFLSEYALYLLIRHHFGKRASYDAHFSGDPGPHDVRIRVSGQEVGLGVRSRRHRELETYHGRGEPLYVGYPTRRANDPAARIPDYVIAATVRSNPDGSSSVGFYGATPRDSVADAIRSREVKRVTTPYVELPLEDFRPDLLDRVLTGADADNKLHDRSP